MFRSVSFYSFKGGAGRSTTCLNTIPYIFEIGEASSEHPIVLLDVDLDSAGMTYLLEQENFFHGLTQFMAQRYKKICTYARKFVILWRNLYIYDHSGVYKRQRCAIYGGVGESDSHPLRQLSSGAPRRYDPLCRAVERAALGCRVSESRGLAVSRQSLRLCGV